MIFHDRVIVITGGGRDRDGNYLPEVENGPYPANVLPIRSSETVTAGGVLVVALYRLHIGPHGGSDLTTTGKVKWQGRQHTIQGDVEPWIVHGRLHHYEATMRRL